jgi:hypothetical protein
MPGDPLRDAFRAELATVRTAASVTWPIKDTLNTNVNPDASSGYLELEFPGGVEEQYTFGAPSNNLHREIGQVTIRVVAPRGNVTNRNLAETYAAAIRNAFRMRRFAVGTRSVRITSTAPMGGGEDEGGMWSESLALGYEIYNVG